MASFPLPAFLPICVLFSAVGLEVLAEVEAQVGAGTEVGGVKAVVPPPHTQQAVFAVIPPQAYNPPSSSHFPGNAYLHRTQTKKK